MVNWEFFDNQSPSGARDLVDDLRAGHPVVPTRGAPLCPFTQTARTLAGLPDPRPDTGPLFTGDATLAGLQVAREQQGRP
jgi:NADH-quinone oxidoreductase subunit E